MRLDEEKEEDEDKEEVTYEEPYNEANSIIQEENDSCPVLPPEIQIKPETNGCIEIGVLDLNEDDELEPTCEEDEDDEDYDFVIVKQWSLRTCWRSRYSVVCLYIILVLVLLASLLALLIVVSMVTLPYQRASGFMRSTCEVVSAHQHSSPSICSCGKGCDSHYPCLVIEVQYIDHAKTMQNASMYENEIVLGKRVSGPGLVNFNFIYEKGLGRTMV